ncbi:MAG: formylglycine-generating enzyme family protein, partial [bacterium]
MSNIQKKSSFKNSLDMKMLKVEPGGFEMGREKGGNWDERPVHQVEISYPFYVSQQVVTEKQFKQFQPEVKGTPEFIPEMSGISWEQAMEFCEWLTEKEGRPYRLPTEAEWEYICKKGLEDSSSYKNKWGVQNLLTGVREWCYDRYGDYRAEKQVDPLGPDWGISRVVRGGGLDELTFQEEKKKIYSRPSNRASMAPAFGHRKEDKNNFGYHCIGFRIVQAPLPKTKPYSYKSSNIQKGVKQKKVMLNKGPDETKPYITRRYMSPT